MHDHGSYRRLKEFHDVAVTIHHQGDLMRTIEFLDQLGRMPRLSGTQYEAAVADFGLEAAEAESLRGRDASKLATLLGGRAQMWCAVMAPEDMPGEERPGEPAREEPEPDSQVD
jgi:hypothetical protein